MQRRGISDTSDCQRPFRGPCTSCLFACTISLEGVSAAIKMGPQLAALILLPFLHTTSAASSALASALPEGPPALRPPWPVVVNVWPFLDASERAWAVLEGGGSAVDAVVEGCAVCEREQCDLSVGFGGSPGENGETTLDALVMDGDTMDVGAVGGLRRVKHAALAAKMVLQHTAHSLLVGDAATAFALEMGIPGPEDLSTPQSRAQWAQWEGALCQPNYRRRVEPNSSRACGPYSPLPPLHSRPAALHSGGPRRASTGGSYSALRRQMREMGGREQRRAGPLREPQVAARPSLQSHDTITMVAIAKDGSMAAGSSTNGLTYHVPGRVGDAPIAGAGTYVDSEVGGCGATGDGDVMMRFLPCFHAVELMRQGTDPTKAAQEAIRRIRRKYPLFQGALFAVNRTGHHGAAVNNWILQYTVRHQGMSKPRVFEVKPVEH